ncbi:hypothetical protein NPA07_03410 [Mycoplasmopsis caviae]|uniref:Uncharacterized protein n=1 Tax=Mycoplasmopsis caviae TaxID=55603 RepID=A0A3P8MFC1_9BACT|nr:hypothetical protein [Mycoplasmopsis caviae]UUD34845.1 hypothetical protein NPA07_03410 [Mycoplasmopsis caviae]VDR42303.1 Uncharacterised protein [Mycoplasmopsis caviae]
MTNNDFLEMINASFIDYLESKSGSRSTKKLKKLHSFFADAIKQRIGSEYIIMSQDNFGGKEYNAEGRYTKKFCDIAILKNERVISSIEIKFVVENYKQNSVNYFNSMLGETANLRSNKMLCFQVIIIINNLPYFSEGYSSKNVQRLEKITSQNLEKYVKLGEDNIDAFYHTPNKTLLIILNNEFINEVLVGKSKDEYCYRLLTLCNKQNKFVFDNSHKLLFENSRNIIFNDFELFISKISHKILGE